MTDPDRPCPHEDFAAFVDVNRLEDSGAFVADLRIDCAVCGSPFTFPADTPIGVDLNGIARNVNGQILRIGIRPAVDIREITEATP